MRAVLVPAALALASVLLSISVNARADQAAPPPVPSREVADARAQIEATLAQMRATSLRVRDQLRATRKHGSKPQITCVDESLSRSDVSLRRARDLGDDILAAYGRADVDAARATRHRLAELREYQRQIALTATSCTPRPIPLPASHETTVSLHIDPNIPPPQ